MKTIILAASVSLLFTGCASVVNDSTHPIKIETQTAAGQVVAGADCKLTNDYGVTNAKSGDTVQVRRSSKDLSISCLHPQNPEAKGNAISRANGGMWGNVLLGGGIGAIIDHNKGTAYTYPTWVQMIFGKDLTFDRSNQKEEAVVVGVEAPAKPVTAAAPATASVTAPGTSN